MTGGLIVLALLMAAVTYPSRAVPLLAPAFERLPVRALEYLRLVGPAVLGAIAASQALLVMGADGRPRSTSGSTPSRSSPASRSSPGAGTSSWDCSSRSS